ncbi:MAG: hypothetical protein LQ352_006118 [Teloschistes flavicans]|nr:MAG: hypothetical protein LQ352_006118 [Teloschistes flavicans]
MAMPTPASVVAWFRDENTAVIIEDSFLPGWSELVFVSRDSIDRPLRVVRTDDPRAQDMREFSVSVLREVKVSWMIRAIRNARAVKDMNTKSGQQDGLWWDPWLRHERKAKAVKEAAAVVLQCGDMSHIPRHIATHLADLINRELIDVDVLDALTRPLIARGSHSSIIETVKDIRAQRKTRGDQTAATAFAKPIGGEAAVETSVDTEENRREGAATALPASISLSPELAAPDDTYSAEGMNAPLVSEHEVHIPDDALVPESSLASTDTKEVQPTQINPAQDHDSNTNSQSPLATGATRQTSPSKSESASAADLTSLVPLQQSSNPDYSVPEATDHLAFTTTSESSESTATVVPDRAIHTGKWSSVNWAYKTSTPMDAELSGQGAWLYDRPSALAQWGQAAAPNLPHGIPIIVLPEAAEAATPSVSTDGHVLLLESHRFAFKGDSRSIHYFAGLSPDFQTTSRLPEYQAIELLGRGIWRHDRELLRCSSLTCQKLLSDMSPSTVVCHGCGPKSTIRWCSLDCKLRNLESHGQYCGDPQSILLATIDSATAPPRFSFMPAPIRDKYRLHTVQRYRQKVYAQHSTGRYTIFDPQSHEPTMLLWEPRYSTRLPSKEVPFSGYALEMEARIERCLNIALFDHHQTTVIEFLFRLLQHLLHLKDSYTPAIYHVLAEQFRHEFAYDVGKSLRIARNYEGMCECEWAGAARRQARHNAGCSRGGKVRDVGAGELFRTRMGVKDLVEGMEKNNWILRAWRCQHPVVGQWTERVKGNGF